MPLQSATYTFQDFSGAATSSNSADLNPYKGLIEACDDDCTQIQARYNTHRTARTSQQRDLLLSPDFAGMNIDPILIGVMRQEEKRKRRHNDTETTTNGVQASHLSQQEKEFVDHRHNFSFWARPPQRVRDLVGECQRRLREVVPDLWLMPLESLHMTTLELYDSRDAAAIVETRAALGPYIEKATNFPCTLHNPPSTQNPDDAVTTAIRSAAPFPGGAKRARLVKPLLAYDATAVALTWLPAVSGDEDAYTYHHFRRDMWELLSETSTTNADAAMESGHKLHGPVPVKSRYVVPSAHLTITRNVNRWDVKEEEAARHPEAVENHDEGVVDHEKVKAFVEALDGVNAWLKSEFWEATDGQSGAKEPIQWIIGEEKGLDCRCGTSWYGGGTSLRLGEGF